MATLKTLLALGLSVSGVSGLHARAGNVKCALVGGTGAAELFPWPTADTHNRHLRSPTTSTARVAAGATLDSIYFSGCGFMLPFHFGVAKALMDHDVKFRTATGTSGGVMAALAILGGADIDVGIRQCFDLRLEPAAMPWSFSSFFQAYRQYFHIYRPAEYKEKTPLSELRDRLFVRLGKFNGRFFEDDESDDGDKLKNRKVENYG